MSLESMEKAVAVQKNNHFYYNYVLSLFLFGLSDEQISYKLPAAIFPSILILCIDC